MFATVSECGCTCFCFWGLVGYKEYRRASPRMLFVLEMYTGAAYFVICCGGFHFKVLCGNCLIISSADTNLYLISACKNFIIIYYLLLYLLV